MILRCTKATAASHLWLLRPPQPAAFCCSAGAWLCRSVSSWLAYIAAFMVCAQLAGLNITPLLAVGGASSILVGLATQQLLTNVIMGLTIFLARPFVAGDTGGKSSRQQAAASPAPFTADTSYAVSHCMCCVLLPAASFI